MLKGLLGAFLSALLATSCCMPALLFLLFGVSFGFLSFLEYLSPFRIPLSLLSLAILYLSWRSQRCSVFTCKLQKRNLYVWIYGLVLGAIVFILLYPEMAVFFFEESE